MNTLDLSLVAATGLVAMCVHYRRTLFTNEIKQPSCSAPTLEDDRRAGATLPIREQTPFSALARPTLYPLAPTLFLDIDGVCHKNFDESFSCLPLIESFLLDRQDVQIVLSSTWRTTCNEQYLSHCLGKVVWERVVGFTPILGTREQEVLAFVQAFRLSKFVCLDDDRDEFFGGVPVIFTDRKKGFTELELVNLYTWHKKDASQC